MAPPCPVSLSGSRYRCNGICSTISVVPPATLHIRDWRLAGGIRGRGPTAGGADLRQAGCQVPPVGPPRGPGMARGEPAAAFARGGNKAAAPLAAPGGGRCTRQKGLNRALSRLSGAAQPPARPPLQGPGGLARGRRRRPPARRRLLGRTAFPRPAARAAPRAADGPRTRPIARRRGWAQNTERNRLPRHSGSRGSAGGREGRGGTAAPPRPRLLAEGGGPAANQESELWWGAWRAALCRVG